MELWDIYDINRNKTGKIINRNSYEKLREGEYHLVVDAVIINSDKKILLSKRSEFKQKYPLLWECTGGSCIKGENSLQGILREVSEELGINFKESEAIFYKTIRDDKARDFKDIWLFRKDIELKELNFSDNEVVEAKWVTIDEFEEMLNKKEIVPTIDFTRRDYEECLKKKIVR